MSLSAATLALYEKLASLVYYEVPEKQIADTIGVTVDELKIILAHESFIEVKDKYILDKVTRQTETADTWDSLELKAIKEIDSHLDYNKDAVFALQVARVANTAKRRGLGDNVDPIAPNNGARVVITMSNTYIQHINSPNLPNGDATAKPKLLDNEQTIDIVPVSRLKDMAKNINETDITEAEVRDLLEGLPSG